MDTPTTQSLPLLVQELLAQSPEAADNMANYNWRLVRDVQPNKNDTLRSVRLLKPNEDPITGSEMEKRALELGNLAGLLHAKKYIDKPRTIPRRWKGKKHLFLGTDCRGPFEARPIACLVKTQGKWQIIFIWLAGIYTSEFRLVRLQKKLRPRRGSAL